MPLLLAAIAASLAGYILLVDRHHATTDEARAVRGRLLPRLARADVTAIEIDRGGKGRVLLARTPTAGGGGDWTVGPDRKPAAGGAVADLLDAIDGLEIDREATAAPGAAGLAPPALRLAIVAGAGREVLDVGGTDASGRGVFVRRAGDARTLVVARRLRDLTDRDAAAFRDRRLFSPGISETATALAFETNTGPRRTLRKRGGLWLDEEGFFATRAATAEALRTLAALEASDFPALPPARRAPPPQQILEVTAGTRLRLELWPERCGAPGSEPHHLAALTPEPDAAPDTLIINAGESAPKIAAEPAEWLCLDPAVVSHLWRLLGTAGQRELHLLPVDATTADGVVVSEGNRRLHLRRDPGAGWRIAEPAVTYAADAEVVDAWLAHLATMLIDVKVSPRPAAKPSRKLVIEGAQRAEIDVASPRGPTARADRTGEVGPATVPAALYAELDPDPLRFRARTVLALPRFDVTRIDIRSPRGHVTLRREAQGGGAEGWTASDDSRADHADPVGVDRVLNALADLRAERFESDGAPFIADTTLDLEVRSGNTTTRYRLELAGHCRARVADTATFSINPATCAALEQKISLDP